MSHDNGDGHDHRHGANEPGLGRDHQHDAEGGWEPSLPGTVMLDIGPGQGALVVVCPPGLLGGEIEAEPLDWPASWPLVHTAVRERFVPAGTVHAAVFPALRPGRYRLVVRGGPDRLVDCAQVSPGCVAEVTIGRPVH